MKVRVFIEQSFDLDLRVNLGGSYVSMPQHLLHRPNVRSPHQQMGGEGVPQAMRSQVFLNARPAGVLLDQHPNHFP